MVHEHIALAPYNSSVSRQKDLSTTHLYTQLDPFALKLTNWERKYQDELENKTTGKTNFEYCLNPNTLTPKEKPQQTISEVSRQLGSMLVKTMIMSSKQGNNANRVLYELTWLRLWQRNEQETSYRLNPVQQSVFNYQYSNKR